MTELNVVARIYGPAVEAFLADEQDTSARVLCELGGRDAEEEITRFVMEDYAGCLVNLVADEQITMGEAIAHLRGVNESRIGDVLCDASHWTEVFADFATYEVQWAPSGPFQTAADLASRG